MSDPAVINWDRIIHKNVRSKDMEGAGNVVAIDGDSVIISTQGGQHQYKIPKSHVEGYNGAEVYLDLSVGELSALNTGDNNKSQAINKEILANESKQETAKIPIPPVASKTITRTTAAISPSRTQNYDNNKPEKTLQGALITSTTELHKQPSNNINNIQKEQDLRKKEETISSIREVGGPVKPEVKVRPSQSITPTANETSTLSATPTTETQSNNNKPAPPQSSLTTKTLAESSEKTISEEATEVAADKAVSKIEASSMTDNAKIHQQSQQKIENELIPSSSTKQRLEVEVTIKPPDNIEFNPPISAENISTAMETGLSGSSAVDDIKGSKEQEERQRLQSLHEVKIGQNNNNNKDLVNSITPFTTGFALWQHSIIYWIDMYNEFVTDAVKLNEYWFNAFVNASTKIQEQNDEK
jgi:hypothetical protein